MIVTDCHYSDKKYFDIYLGQDAFNVILQAVFQSKYLFFALFSKTRYVATQTTL